MWEPNFQTKRTQHNLFVIPMIIKTSFFDHLTKQLKFVGIQRRRRLHFGRPWRQEFVVDKVSFDGHIGLQVHGSSIQDAFKSSRQVWSGGIKAVSPLSFVSPIAVLRWRTEPRVALQECESIQKIYSQMGYARREVKRTRFGLVFA